ncbi:MAG: response regulator [Desulfobacteraceae bacterium]|jgi:PAS domain S-box-containing protein|nr:response regulator [Desulfobacteraceae bacterium]
MQKKILVVDDTQLFLKLMERILLKQGHKVVTAADGFEALQVLSSFVPDVMFVDLVMPKISGDRLCQLVRKMPHLRHCRIVIVSAAVSELDYDYRKIGADLCISKVTQEGFAESVTAAVGDQQSDPPLSRPNPSTAQRRERTIHEITHALVTESAHQETILETIPEGVMELTSGIVTYANSQAVSLFERPLGGVLGSSFPSLFPETDRQRVQMLTDAAEKTPKDGTEEALVLGGREVMVHVAAVPGESDTHLAILQDVTEQQEVKRALRQAMEHTESIITSMAESLLVVTADSKVNFANPAACEMLGYTEHELFNYPMDSILAGDDTFQDAVYRPLQQSGVLRKPSLQYRTRSGERVPVSFLATLIHDECTEAEHRCSVLCIAHDMREIDRLQSQVSQAEKMATAGLLSAGVAHEIKNPLAIILQGLDALGTSLQRAPNREVLLDMIRRIRNAAERADFIVRGLLDFARQSPSHFSRLSPEALLDEAVALVEHQFRIQGVRVERTYSRERTLVRADKNQLLQVVINLLVNAIEAISENGIITVGTRLEVDDRLGKYVQISVSDNGKGIPPEELDRIFEPFFTTKTDALNTGLGLSVSNGIIDKHGGSIEVRSEVGSGTDVIVFLPCE